MVEKFFLALDYEEGSKAVEAGEYAMGILRKRFGSGFVDGTNGNGRVGLKLPPNLLVEPIGHHLAYFCRDRPNFLDAKFNDDPVGSERYLARVASILPVSYATIAASMGAHMMRKHVKYAHKYGVEVLAATAHTHMPADDVQAVYNRECADAVYFLSYMAFQAGCDGIVVDGAALRNPSLQDIPVKKLVTGIRIMPEERRRQSRVTLLDEARELKEHIDYVVVSSGYLDKPDDLIAIFSALL